MSISNAPNNLDKIKKLKMTITKYENELRKRVTNLHNKNTTEKEIDEIIESLEIALNKIKK